jgi:hypothetical protein
MEVDAIDHVQRKENGEDHVDCIKYWCFVELRDIMIGGEHHQVVCQHTHINKCDSNHYKHRACAPYGSIGYLDHAKGKKVVARWKEEETECKKKKLGGDLADI